MKNSESFEIVLPVFNLIAGVLYLACKLEENHKRLSEIITILDQLRLGKAFKEPLNLMSSTYQMYREGALKAERLILTSLAFEVHGI